MRKRISKLLCEWSSAKSRFVLSKRCKWFLLALVGITNRPTGAIAENCHRRNRHLDRRHRRRRLLAVITAKDRRRHTQRVFTNDTDLLPHHLNHDLVKKRRRLRCLQDRLWHFPEIGSNKWLFRHWTLPVPVIISIDMVTKSICDKHCSIRFNILNITIVHTSFHHHHHQHRRRRLIGQVVMTILLPLWLRLTHSFIFVMDRLYKWRVNWSTTKSTNHRTTVMTRQLLTLSRPMWAFSIRHRAKHPPNFYEGPYHRYDPKEKKYIYSRNPWLGLDQSHPRLQFLTFISLRDSCWFVL